MTVTTTIPKRIRHKNNCGHPQTPYARRKCRAALVASITAYQAGDQIDIDGTVITLIAKRRFSQPGIAWSWCIPDADVYSEVSKATAEEALELARRQLATRCHCGDLATMRASLGPTCTNHYDTLAA